MKCLGCDSAIPWDGKSAFCYTCPCGATIFYDEKKGLFPPASLVIGLHKGRELPHIDYYIGKSSYWSPLKQQMYEFLRSEGSIWSWECNKCKKRVLQRATMEKTEGFYRLDFHPELQKLISP